MRTNQSPGSIEYQNFVQKIQVVHIEINERVQNPHHYLQSMVRKQKMDKDNGGNNELQLFHETDAKNKSAINTQGFNRSICGVHCKYCYYQGGGIENELTLYLRGKR